MNLKQSLLFLTSSSLLVTAGVLTYASVSISDLGSFLQEFHDEELVVLAAERMPELNRLNASIHGLLNADRDGYQAVLAEGSALLSTDSATYAAAVASARENLVQVHERLTLASAEFDNSVLSTWKKTESLYGEWSALLEDSLSSGVAPDARPALIASAPERKAKRIWASCR